MKDVLLEDKLVLEKLAIKINEKFFGGKLPEIVINTEPKKKSLGHFFANSWTDGEKTLHEINVSPIYFKKGALSVTNTLHHEMVHLYNRLNDIKDVSGRRHNKKFYQSCVDHGLLSEKIEGPIGYTTFDTRDKQFPEWLTWFDQIAIELELDNHFKYSYVSKATIASKRINTSFTCVTTGQKFYLTDKLAKEYYDGTITITSPYEQGGDALPSDEV